MPFDASLKFTNPADNPFAEPDLPSGPAPDPGRFAEPDTAATELSAYIRESIARLQAQQPEPEPPKPPRELRHTIKTRGQLIRGE
jgi:hypothetical protein